MSPLIFTTAPDSPYNMELAGVGTMAGNAQGGIVVTDAAEVLPELQDRSGEPLSGKKLDDAARALAERNGFAVKSLKNVDREKLRVEAGAFPAGKGIREFSREAVERDLGHEVPGAAEEDNEGDAATDPASAEGGK